MDFVSFSSLNTFIILHSGSFLSSGYLVILQATSMFSLSIISLNGCSTIKRCETLSSSGKRYNRFLYGFINPVTVCIFRSVTFITLPSLTCLPLCSILTITLSPWRAFFMNLKGTKISFSPSLSGITKPLPLFVHHNVPVWRFIS